MKWLLRTREVVQAFYSRYCRHVDRLLRFVFALLTYLTVFYFTGYNAAVTNPFIAVGLAVASAFLPVSSIPVLTALLLAIEFASVSIEIPIITLVLFALILLLYFVFRAETGWLLVFSMLACLMGLSPLVLVTALVISPVDLIVIVFGILVYGLVAVVRKDISVLSSSGSLTMGGRVNLILTDMLTDDRFLLLLVAIAASVLLICVIRRSKRNYAGVIAIAVGDLLYALLMLGGAFFLEITISIPGLIGGLIINALAAFIILFVVRSMDYKRAEEVRFEDDDYYYFVKAVPKTVIRATEKKEAVITSQPAETLNTDNLFRHHHDSGEEDE